jgi:hypothetical protein
MDEYARSYGHEPTESWILVVHPDDTSEFHPFPDPSTMWCCVRRGAVRDMIGAEVGRAGVGASGDPKQSQNESRPEAEPRKESYGT